MPRVDAVAAAVRMAETTVTTVPMPQLGVHRRVCSQINYDYGHNARF